MHHLRRPRLAALDSVLWGPRRLANVLIHLLPASGATRERSGAAGGGATDIRSDTVLIWEEMWSMRDLRRAKHFFTFSAKAALSNSSSWRNVGNAWLPQGVSTNRGRPTSLSPPNALHLELQMLLKQLHLHLANFGQLLQYRALLRAWQAPPKRGA